LRERYSNNSKKGEIAFIELKFSRKKYPLRDETEGVGVGSKSCEERTAMFFLYSWENKGLNTTRDLEWNSYLILYDLFTFIYFSNVGNFES